MSSGPYRPDRAPLISASQLLESITAAGQPFSRDDVRIVDARWYLGGKRGRDEYDAGHIPGAVFVDLDRDLSAPPGRGPGRHPLPSAEAFSATLSRLGVTPTTRVIAYDDAGGAIAARVWWLLRHFGLDNGAVLDGSIRAFLDAGGTLTKQAPSIVPAPRLKLAGRTNDVAHKHAVDKLRQSPTAIVIDARSGDRFEGKSEPIDARPGHIPNARSLPFAGNLVAPGGPFLDRAALEERYGMVRDAQTLVCYCGSGVTACHNLLALALLGRDDALLYEGSWSDWAKDASLPAALG